MVNTFLATIIKGSPNHYAVFSVTASCNPYNKLLNKVDSIISIYKRENWGFVTFKEFT